MVAPGGVPVKRRITQTDIARRARVDVSTVSKVLTLGPAAPFREPTIERVLAIAQQLGYDLARIRYAHRRRSGRHPAAFRAELSIVLPDGRLFDQGTATIRDLSATGALIGDLALPGGTMPAEPFDISLRVLEGDLSPCEFPGRVVRLIHGEGGLALGIAFPPQLPETLRRTLTAFCDR